MELTKINKLQKEIQEVKDFLGTVNSFWNIRRGSGVYDINVVMKMKHERSISVLGSRWFGIGTYRQEIIVPNHLLTCLEDLAKVRLEELESELQNTLKEMIL